MSVAKDTGLTTPENSRSRGPAEGRCGDGSGVILPAVSHDGDDPVLDAGAWRWHREERHRSERPGRWRSINHPQAPLGLRSERRVKVAPRFPSHRRNVASAVSPV